MKISIITTTVRPLGLPIIERSLKRQTLKDFEWIIVAPEKIHEEITKILTIPFTLLSDPPKNEGDFWTLCKAWNKGYAHARGELIINVQDWIWLEPDTLERFWNHYQSNPKSIVSAVGDHYDQVDEKGRPMNTVWEDPRVKSKGFYLTDANQIEMSVCSVPQQAVLDCGGVDEIYDTCNGVQEKEMCFRLMALGYEMYIDEDIKYLALHHGRLTKNWDEIYWNVTAPLFQKHAHELITGTRTLNVNNILKYNKSVKT